MERCADVPEEAWPPLRVRRSADGARLSMTPARTRAWLDGWALTEGTGLRPRRLAQGEDWVRIEPIGEAIDPAAALRALPARRERIAGTRRELLAALDDEVSLPRALGKVGIGRRHVDRWLDERIEAEVDVLEVGFGGIGPRFWRRGADGPVAVRLDRVRRDAWRALELAGVGAQGDDAIGALARVAVRLRDAVVAGDPTAARDEVEAIVRGAPEPSRARVWIDGPAAIEGLWERPGAEVDARRARWLLRQVDGLGVAGERVSVRVEPPIRAGRAGPRREDRRARERRRFARWDEGVEVDDEGLVGLTPEAVALALAARTRGVVIDGTCGAGGLAIALARTSSVDRVIAVDVYPERLAMARHNAGIYGVADRIEFVHGDVIELLAERTADWLVLDPPWGGRAYDRDRVGLDDLPMDVAGALARFEGPVLLKLPRSFDPATLPGRWNTELVLDAREVPKLLLAVRAPHPPQSDEDP